MIQVKAETIREAIDQLEASQNDKYVQSTENIINDLKQALSINGVSQQRELLSRFLKYYNRDDLTVSDEIDIDLFLNDNNKS